MHGLDGRTDRRMSPAHPWTLKLRPRVFQPSIFGHLIVPNSRLIAAAAAAAATASASAAAIAFFIVLLWSRRLRKQSSQSRKKRTKSVKLYYSGCNSGFANEIRPCTRFFSLFLDFELSSKPGWRIFKSASSPLGFRSSCRNPASNERPRRRSVESSVCRGASSWLR